MIDLVTLKQDLEHNTFKKRLMIFICKEVSAKFVARQYSHYFAYSNGLEVELIEDFSHLMGNGFFTSDKLFLYKTDTLENVPRTKEYVWIICKSLSKEIETNFSDSIVIIDKLEDWQVIDYLISTAPISEDDAKYLMQEYKDLVKLDIEVEKLRLFSENKMRDIADQLFYRPDAPIFDLVNGLIKRDFNAVSKFIEKGVEVEPFALLALLKKNLKQVIDIQLSKGATAESLGMSSKQFWAVSKYSCNHYTREELLYIYDILTQLDLKVKTGELDTSHMVNFIVTKFLTLRKE